MLLFLLVKMISVYVLVAIAIIALCYIHLVRHFNYWKNKKVPFIAPILLFGNIWPILKQEKSIDTFLRHIYNATTLPYFGFFVFDQPFMLLRDPHLIKKVLVSDFDYFQDRSIMENKHDKYTVDTLFMAKQPKWKSMRTKVTSVFTSGKLKNMVPLIVEAGEDFVRHIREVCLKDDSTECRNISFKYAIDVISSCAFGIKINAYGNSQFITATKGVQGVSFARLVQMASHFFAPFLVKMFRMKFSDPESSKFLETVFLDTIQERKKSTKSRGDLIDLLIQNEMQKSDIFDEDTLVALAFQFLVAGYETSGATIAYILYELSLDASIQHRLREEIVTVLENYERITYEAVQEMQYLDMVVKEALRKYPTLPFLDRRCTKTYTIPNSDVVIEKGIPVYISMLALHLDEKYFPNPTKFDPDRFLPENKDRIVPYTYMPFGEGYRNCLGTKFGILTVCVGLIQILKNFEVEMSRDTPNTLSFEPNGFLLIPSGNVLHVKFKALS